MGYYDVMRRRVTLGGERLSLCQKAGLVDWSEVEQAAMLLAEHADVAAGMRVLLMESGGGALAVWGARQGAEMHCYDGRVVGARMTRETLAANDQEAAVHDAEAPGSADSGRFDVALLVLPKGRAYGQALFGAAFAALRSGGKLYFAGPNSGGAKAAVKDAGAIFGRAATVTTRARNRVAVAVKLADGPGAASPREAMREFEAVGLRLYGTPGVFSQGTLDDGTARLLDTLDEGLCREARVLDIGCGSGVVGLYSARLGAAAVQMIDAQWLAVTCTRAGIRANGLDGVCRAAVGDLYDGLPADPAYDLVLSNPPFHIGHRVDTDAARALIRGAYDRLSKGGRLRIVANLFLPYDGVMRDVFGAGQVRTVQEDARFRVLEAVR